MPDHETHRLTPLLEPRSIAIIGASGRPGRPGFTTVRAVTALGFTGPVYPVTPSYDTIEGHQCFSSIAAVPEPVDLVVVAGSSARLEGQVREAIESGARSVLAYANINELRTADPSVADRLRDMVREAGVPLAGPYSIGFVNPARNTAAAWLEPDTRYLRRGAITAIIHSGATYSYSLISDPRAGFALNVHPGQELDLSVADYMDYALAAGETRVIGLFLEAVRDPERFRAALERAQCAGVPVVVLHVGRSADGAKHVLSHAGKLAGATSALDAVFRHHGVFRVDTMEQWWASLLLFSETQRLGPGEVVAMVDSGGQRALLADFASDLGVPWTEITSETRTRIAEQLDPTLTAENPLDAWGGEPDWRERCQHFLSALIEDPGAAIGVVFTDFSATDVDPVPLALAEICRDVARESAIPVIAAQYTARHFHPAAIHLLSDAGIAVLDGGRDALVAIRNALSFRDQNTREPMKRDCGLSARECARWQARSTMLSEFDESTSLRLLGEFGIPVIEHAIAETLEDVLRIASDVSYPVALKTAAFGVAHKSDERGVVLEIKNETELITAYRQMRERLGARVLVAAMSKAGIELSLGMVRDPQFGPVVMLGSGGIMIELMADVVFALPPFDETEAARLLESLLIAPRLRGLRGEPAVDWEELCRTVSRFSAIAASCGETVMEIDVNPIIAGEWGCVAVDALLINKNQQEKSE
jgi:acyl-CoA synthetase (NDP forming)